VRARASVWALWGARPACCSPGMWLPAPTGAGSNSMLRASVCPPPPCPSVLQCPWTVLSERRRQRRRAARSRCGKRWAQTAGWWSQLRAPCGRGTRCVLLGLQCCSARCCGCCLLSCWYAVHRIVRQQKCTWRSHTSQLPARCACLPARLQLEGTRLTVVNLSKGPAAAAAAEADGLDGAE
jgi:hypothetical protein